MGREQWVQITSADWDAWWKSGGKSFEIHHCTDLAGLHTETTYGYMMSPGYTYARCPLCTTVWTPWFDPLDHGMTLKKRSAPEPRYKLVEVTDGRLRYTKLVEVK